MATVIKLNDEEAKRIFDLKFGNVPYTLERFCERWSEAFGVQLICVTMGSAGCALYSNHSFRTFEGYSVDVVDTVGAGDAFAAACCTDLISAGRRNVLHPSRMLWEQ